MYQSDGGAKCRANYKNGQRQLCRLCSSRVVGSHNDCKQDGQGTSRCPPRVPAGEIHLEEECGQRDSTRRGVTVHFCHLAKLVDAIYMYSSECISQQDFLLGRSLLEQFYHEFSTLYGS